MPQLSDYMNPEQGSELYKSLEKRITVIQGMILSNRFLADNLRYMPEPEHAESFKEIDKILVELENLINKNSLLSSV